MPDGNGTDRGARAAVRDAGAREPRAKLRELERRSRAAELEAVVTMATTLLTKRWSKRDQAFIRFHLGQAYGRLLRPAQALPHLRFARACLEGAGDDQMLVEALDWESATLGLVNDPDAIPMAMAALDKCRRLEPKQPQIEARILGHIAGIHLTAHTWAEAVRFYQSAADAAGSVRDLGLEAKMHHGLAVAFERIQPHKARQHYERALALYTMLADGASMHRIENDFGFMMVKEGKLDLAEALLLRALAGCEELQMEWRGLGYVLNNLAELNLRRGDVKLAAKCAQWGMAAAEAVGERLVQADAHHLLAGCEEHEGHPSAADEHMGAALGMLQALGMPDRVRESQARYQAMLNGRHPS